MSNEYRNNHYVPVWYQKRFLPPGKKDQELFYLDLNPDTFIDPRGISHKDKALKRLGFKHCFYEKDLYKSNFGGVESTKIEQIFFGSIDSKGRNAVDYFTNFKHPSVNGEAFEDMMRYMSTQKLRTPKGLSWLQDKMRTSDKDAVLAKMLELQQLYCAIWTESIWLIADASKSSTKFIVSDHPVTVYNRACPPNSKWCQGFDDPDIWLQATHTIFPLSLEKVLILTNLSWVRNPYQSEIKLRPHPNPFRGAIFKFTDIQTMRNLSEQEVREINFVIKKRAHRYVAAAQEDWLYPERSLPNTDWQNFGSGYLFMPDPRGVTYGGELIIGLHGGGATGYDAYGRRPWHPEYNKEDKEKLELKTLYHFKGEFARIVGPYRRGRTFEFMKLDNEFDDEEFHKYHLGLETETIIRQLWKTGKIDIGRNDPCICGSGSKWKKCGYLETDKHKELMSKFIDITD